MRRGVGSSREQRPCVSQAGAPEAGTWEAGVREAGVREAGTREAGAREAGAREARPARSPTPRSQGRQRARGECWLRQMLFFRRPGSQTHILKIVVENTYHKFITLTTFSGQSRSGEYIHIIT